MKHKKKSNKGLVIILIIIISILLLGSVVVFIALPTLKNNQVDLSANKINEVIAKNNWTNKIDDDTAFANLIELTMLNAANINEDALIYYDGSKNKLEEVKNNLKNTINQYKLKYDSYKLCIFDDGRINFDGASNSQLKSAKLRLNEMSNIIKEQMKSEWSQFDPDKLIWGNDNNSYSKNCLNFDKAINQKVSEIQNKLDK